MDFLVEELLQEGLNYSFHSVLSGCYNNEFDKIIKDIYTVIKNMEGVAYNPNEIKMLKAKAEKTEYMLNSCLRDEEFYDVRNMTNRLDKQVAMNLTVKFYEYPNKIITYKNKKS